MTDPPGRLVPSLESVARLLDAAMLGVIALGVTTDVDGCPIDAVCVDATPGACRLLGVSRQSLLNTSLLTTLAGWSDGDPLDRLRDVLAGKAIGGLLVPSAAVEAGMVRVNRPDCQAFARARLVSHDGGILVLLSDATAEVEATVLAAQADRRSEAVEQRLVDAHMASPDPFALFDPEDRLILCNEAWIETSGLAGTETVVGRRFDVLTDQVVRSGCWAGMEPGERNALKRWRLSAHRRASGEEFDVPGEDDRMFRIRERRTSDGGIVCTATEVTQPANQRRLLSRAIESIDQALALFDSDDRLIMWNSRYANAIGPDLIHAGMSFEEVALLAAEQTASLTTRDGAPFALGERIAAHRSGVKFIEFERWHADGTVSVVRERRMPDGSMVVTGSPITELKIKEAALEEQVNELDSARAEAERHADHLAEATRQLTIEKERAEAANRTKSRFLANMSHELRTPLNAILGFSEMIKAETFGALGSPRYSDYADDIHASGRHLLSLINDLLDMSKIEAGKYQLEKEATPVTSVIDSVARMVRGRADEASLHLGVERVDPNLVMTVDVRAVKQVLINLATNAIKFTPAGGFVELGCGVDDATVVFSVRDSGIGIDPLDIPRLLRPFEQTQSAENRSVEGTGLGLPLSTALVDLHGGTLIIDSTLGEGTCVTVRLPRT